MNGENAHQVQKTGHSQEAENGKELKQKQIQQHANPGYGVVVVLFSVSLCILRYFI